MAAHLSDHAPITVYQTTDNTTDLTGAYAEAATQTFLAGVPVMINAAGYLVEWTGVTYSYTGAAGTGLLGVCPLPGFNLASAGLGAPGAFTGVGFPGASLTVANVPNETQAVTIYRGVPFVDGRNLVFKAVGATYFLVQVDNSAYAVAADGTLVQGDVGLTFGLTKDTTGHWYLDRSKVAGTNNTVVTVVAGYPNSGVGILNGFAIVKFQPGAYQG